MMIRYWCVVVYSIYKEYEAIQKLVRFNNINTATELEIRSSNLGYGSETFPFKLIHSKTLTLQKF